MERLQGMSSTRKALLPVTQTHLLLASCYLLYLHFMYIQLTLKQCGG